MSPGYEGYSSESAVAHDRNLQTDAGGVFEERDIAVQAADRGLRLASTWQCGLTRNGMFWKKKPKQPGWGLMGVRWGDGMPGSKSNSQ